jgi:hypothetical protein
LFSLRLLEKHDRVRMLDARGTLDLGCGLVWGTAIAAAWASEVIGMGVLQLAVVLVVAAASRQLHLSLLGGV